MSENVKKLLSDFKDEDAQSDKQRPAELKKLSEDLEIENIDINEIMNIAFKKLPPNFIVLQLNIEILALNFTIDNEFD